MKKLLGMMLVLGLAAVPALAVDPEDTVDVTINVLEEVQLWSNDATIALNLDGKNAENSDAVASSLSHINNVAADISVAVDGTLPEPTVSGGGINFFLFPLDNVADAYSAIVADAYNPAGALVWTKDTLGSPAQTFASVPLSNSIDTVDVVYAAAVPGELPMPDSYDLTVTWTIAPQ